MGGGGQPLVTVREVVAAHRPCYVGWAMAGNLIRTVMSWACLATFCGLLLAGSAEGSGHSGRAGSACLERLPGASAMTSVGTIQGAAHTSPFRGRTVATTGIVTAVDTDGFYLQDPVGDGDARTSDGLFVFTGRKPAAAVGDRLCVRGLVAEYQPGGVATNNLTITQITRPRMTRLSRRNRLPAPVALGVGGRVPPGRIIDNDGFAVFDPGEDGIDFYESLEGMRVTVRDAVAVSPTSRFGEIFVRARGTSPSGLSKRGTLTIRPDDFNPERIQIDDDFGLSPIAPPVVKVGDSLGDVTGVVNYGFGNYEVRFTEAFTHTRGLLEPEATHLSSGDGYLTIASFNVLNLDPNDADGDTDVAGGPLRRGGVRDCQESAVSRHRGAPGSTGQRRLRQDRGQGRRRHVAIAGGAHRRPGAGPLPFHRSSVHRRRHQRRPARREHSRGIPLQPAPRGSHSGLGGHGHRSGGSENQPENPFFNGRLPLIAGFRTRAPGHAPVTVINNHFNSKRGSSPLVGQIQPSTELQESPGVNSGVDHRRRQARAVHDFVTARLAARGDAHIVVLGDFNEFAFVSPLRILERSLHNLTQSCLRANAIPTSSRATRNPWITSWSAPR